MSAQARPTPPDLMSPPAFLDWEARQDRPWEFDGTQPVAMVGGTVAHDTINMNLITALGTRLRGKPCRVHGPSMMLSVGDRYRYPDATVTCTPLPPGDRIITDPASSSRSYPPRPNTRTRR